MLHTQEKQRHDRVDMPQGLPVLAALAWVWPGGQQVEGGRGSVPGTTAKGSGPG